MPGRGVVVDDDGVTERAPWATTFVPWNAVRNVEFLDPYHADFVLDDRRRVVVSAPVRRGGPTLREAYVDVLARWSPDMGRGTTYPRPHRRFLTIGFATAALALVAGGVVWDDADYDADRYATRDGRDRDGIAVVTDVRVDEHSGGEGPTTYTTHVRARLRIPDRRSVVVDLHRAGDLGGVYEEEDAVPVVYDTANPRDADFGDRPNRRGDHESVEVRRVVGPVLLAAGIMGVLGFGVAISWEWARRRRDARSGSGASA